MDKVSNDINILLQINTWKTTKSGNEQKLNSIFYENQINLTFFRKIECHMAEQNLACSYRWRVEIHILFKYKSKPLLFSSLSSVFLI